MTDNEQREVASDRRADSIMLIAEWYCARWGYDEMNGHILDRARETYSAVSDLGLLAAPADDEATIERMARAIAESDGPGYWDDPNFREIDKRRARAALAALREAKK